MISAGFRLEKKQTSTVVQTVGSKYLPSAIEPRLYDFEALGTNASRLFIDRSISWEKEDTTYGIARDPQLIDE